MAAVSAKAMDAVDIGYMCACREIVALRQLLMVGLNFLFFEVP